MVYWSVRSGGLGPAAALCHNCFICRIAAHVVHSGRLLLGDKERPPCSVPYTLAVTDITHRTTAFEVWTRFGPTTAHNQKALDVVIILSRYRALGSVYTDRGTPNLALQTHRPAQLYFHIYLRAQIDIPGRTALLVMISEADAYVMHVRLHAMPTHLLSLVSSVLHQSSADGYRHWSSSGVSIISTLQGLFVARIAMLFLVAAATCAVIAKLFRSSMDWFDNMLEKRIDKRTSKLTDLAEKQQRMIVALVAHNEAISARAGNELADKISELRRVMVHEVLEEARVERAKATAHYLDVGNTCLDRMHASVLWEIMGARAAAEAGNAKVYCGLYGYINYLYNRQVNLAQFVLGDFAASPQVAAQQLQRYEERPPQQ